MSVQTLNYILGLGALVSQIVGVLFLLAYLFRKHSTVAASFSNFLSRYGLWFGFLTAVLGTAVSLFYSEILGLVPCGLCWFQRIFLYPQVILLGIAAWKKDRNITTYSLMLSFLGIIVGLYHHYLQLGGNEILPCPASGAGDCAKRFVFELGYLTFPLMSATIFFLLIVIMLAVRGHRSESA